VEQDISRRRQAQEAIARENAMLERQYTLEAQRQQALIDAQNAAKPGDTKVIVDPVTGRKTTFIFQNPGQIIPLNEPKTPRISQ
jgi:hypothetical protein